jgi:hypothetical protein
VVAAAEAEAAAVIQTLKRAPVGRARSK